MTLRLVLITATLGLVFAFFTNYMFVHLSPFDVDKVQELVDEKGIEEDEWDRLDQELELIIEDGDIFKYITTDAYLGFGTLGVAIFCFITSLHLSIDKLFFKKFYEPAHVMNAARRGAEVSVASIGVLILTLLAIDKKIIVIALFAVFLFEIMIVNVLHRHGNNLQDVKEVENESNTIPPEGDQLQSER